MDYKKMKEQLRRHEGVRRKPYTDTVGKLTIGVGRNLTDVGLSHDEIDLLLTNDIEECVFDLSQNFPWWVNIDDVRQRAILDLRFNLGPREFRNWTQTLGAAARSNWFQAALNFRQNKRYFEQVKGRAEAIAHMLETGTE